LAQESLWARGLPVFVRHIYHWPLPFVRRSYHWPLHFAMMRTAASAFALLLVQAQATVSFTLWFGNK